MIRAVISYRSSHSQMFYKIGALKNFSKFTKRTSVTEFIFNKVAGWRCISKTSSRDIRKSLKFFFGLCVRDGCFWYLQIVIASRIVCYLGTNIKSVFRTLANKVYYIGNQPPLYLWRIKPLPKCWIVSLCYFHECS